jgi:predicted nucleic acid-binding protein
MGGLTAEDLCRRHRRIGLDSNVLIYLLDNVEPWAGRAAELVAAVENGVSAAVMSTLALAEILSGPARAGDLGRMERTDAEVRAIPGLAILPLGPELAGDAAVIRGVRGMGLADAIHLATARAAGATAFVTNDRRVRGSSRLEVVYLDDLVPSAP